MINCYTPFLFCQKFIPLFDKNKDEKKFIINVTSMEGKFDAKRKSSRHVHTNIAKAGLNMLTRTCG